MLPLQGFKDIQGTFMNGITRFPRRFLYAAVLSPMACLLAACVVPVPPGASGSQSTVTYGDAEPIAGGPIPTPSMIPSPTEITDPEPSRVVVRAIREVAPARPPGTADLNRSAIATAPTPSPMPSAEASSAPAAAITPAVATARISSPRAQRPTPAPSNPTVAQVNPAPAQTRLPTPASNQAPVAQAAPPAPPPTVAAPRPTAPPPASQMARSTPPASSPVADAQALARQAPSAVAPFSTAPPEFAASPAPRRQAAPPPRPVPRNRPLAADNSAVARAPASPSLPSPQGRPAPPQLNTVPQVDTTAVASRAPLIPLGRDSTEPVPEATPLGGLAVAETPGSAAAPVVNEPLMDEPMADATANLDLSTARSITITVPIPRPRPFPDALPSDGVVAVAVASADLLEPTASPERPAPVSATRGTNRRDATTPVADTSALASSLLTPIPRQPETTSSLSQGAPAVASSASPVATADTSTTPTRRPGLLRPLSEPVADDAVATSLESDGGVADPDTTTDLPTPAVLPDGSDASDAIAQRNPPPAVTPETPAPLENGTQVGAITPALPSSPLGDYDSCQIRELFDGFVSVYLNQGPRTVLMVSFTLPSALSTTEQVLQVLSSGNFEPAAYFPYAPETPDAIRDALGSGGLQCQLSPMG